MNFRNVKRTIPFFVLSTIALVNTNTHTFWGAIAAARNRVGGTVFVDKVENGIKSFFFAGSAQKMTNAFNNVSNFLFKDSLHIEEFDSADLAFARTAWKDLENAVKAAISIKNPLQVAKQVEAAFESFGNKMLQLAQKLRAKLGEKAETVAQKIEASVNNIDRIGKNMKARQKLRLLVMFKQCKF